MASTITAAVAGVQELRRDLESISIGLGKELTKILREEAKPVADRTAALTPRGPGPRGRTDTLPHVADTMVGVPLTAGMGVASTHPAAPILEFAGHEGMGATISPKGVPIVIWPARKMAERAGQEKLPAVERAVGDRIDQLLTRHGF